MNMEEMYSRRQAQEKAFMKKMIALVVLAGILIVGAFSISGLFETVDAGEIVVKQSMLTGDLTIWKEPGPKWQFFGKVTHYPISKQYWFSSKDDQGDKLDQSIKMRFNDGGHGNLSGSIRFTLPQDDESILALHRQFGSEGAIEQSLIRTVIEKAVYLSGPLMSSTQSFAEKRNELVSYIEDQALNGIYHSSSHCEKQPDAVTKIEKTVCMVSIDKDAKGLPVRVEESPLKKFNIKLANLSINDLSYDKEVVDQIKAQQAAIAAVQTAAAQARQAEQRAITVAKEGEASAAKAKWDQEVIAAKAVTEAEQKKTVAKLNKEAAEYGKQQAILEGEGEAQKRKLIMAADGALNQKVQAAIEINKVWAEAYTKQRPTPDVVIGANSDGKAPNDLAQLMMLGAMKQVGLFK